MKKKAMRRSKLQSAACDNKIGHDSRDDAQIHINSLYNSGKARYRLNVYKCRYCGKFHVGRDSKSFVGQRVRSPKWMN